MTGQISRHRDIDALKVAAQWPDADRATVVNLAARLAAVGADADGYRFFAEQADVHPGEPLWLSLAGFFQARTGSDVDAAIAKLDRAADKDLGLPQYFRGLALTALPPDPQRAERAVADLTFVLAVRDQFPVALIRAAHHGLARAYAMLGKDDLAAAAVSDSGLAGLPEDSGLQFGGYWATARDGFRFTSPGVYQPEPAVRVLQGHDFADFALISTGAGIVAIDAGSTAPRVRTALAGLGLADDQQVTHLILTHAHFDHVGGIDALRGPGTQVITHARFPEELRRQRGSTLPFGWFLGEGGSLDHHIAPDRLVSEPEVISAAGLELALYPTPGGETSDALMIYLPSSGLLFTGDVMMPYLGAPFFAEGSPDGLLETLTFIRQLRPRLLIQGHTPLTELFTIETIPGLEAALTELHGQVIADLRGGRTLAQILHQNKLPETLRDHPKAVLPDLVMRDNFTARLYHQRTGYWQPDGTGMEPLLAGERAAALDLLGGGREDSFVAAATTLAGQGDHALALEIISSGLLRYPASAALKDLRRRVLRRLLAQHQQDPFRFLIYAELAGVETGPTR